jgi:hypothetical protein
MALKVVPAGDERCDIHNRRSPQNYICESCLKELGVESAAPVTPRRRPLRVRARRSVRRWRARTDRRVLYALGVGLPVLILVIVLIAGSGGGGSSGPTEAEVVKTLGLVADPNGGTGWITPDGACAVDSIDLGPNVQAGPIGTNLLVEVSNSKGTVGAVVRQNDFSQSESACVARIGAALKAHF